MNAPSQEEWRQQLIDVAASLTAAISLLRNGGAAAKKAAPSNLMFDIMLQDYENSLNRVRHFLNKMEISNEL